MINILLGRPGSGKSYEAVVFHILEALKSGRKVITNLPLNLPVIFSFFPEYADLIEIRETSKSGAPLPFTSVKDFNDEWRGQNGIGALYVIDECHKMFPSSGTPKAVDEWFAEHRHLGVDVLLITQSYRKISRSIVDMIQVVYRLSNNRTLGSDKSYIRKVQDGVRGEVLSTQVRKYNPSNFKFYQSHTKTSASVTESAASDIRPLWYSWPFIGTALFLGLGVPYFIYILIYENPLTSQVDKAKAAYTKPVIGSPSQHARPIVNPVSSIPKPNPSSVPKSQPEVDITDTPFGRVNLHISGFISSKKKNKTLYQFTASQNGQAVFTLSHSDLTFAGYQIRANGSCNAELTYNNLKFYVICDAPRVGVSPGASFATR